MTGTGVLYMIPIPIAEGRLDTVLPSTIAQIHKLEFFVTENARTARRFISSTKPPYAIQDISVLELDKHKPSALEELLNPVLEGKDIGVMSEAGSPGIADPGAELASWAHHRGIKVVPLIGASSITLALMASGMNGQRFTFHGYLSPKREGLKQDLKRIESESRRNRCTQIFIEAPYRNNQVVETALVTLSKDTIFSIASNLTSSDEFVRSTSIKQWRSVDLPDFHKKPSIFLLYAR